MLKKSITYNDYHGEERTEDFYFNLTQSELTSMELSKKGGMIATLEKIISEKDTPKLMEFFKQIIDESYGEKSLDGRRFMKSDDILEDFKQTLAYDKLFMELATDADKASEFVNGMMPEQVVTAKKEQEDSRQVLYDKVRKMEKENREQSKEE